MNWSFKKIGLILLVLCMAFGLAADDSVFIGDGDVGSLKLYDQNGQPLDATMEAAGDIGEGWIISNPGSDVLIVTPVGTVNLYQDSIAITTALSRDDIVITLVRGKATFRATGLDGGSLTVETPASRYTLTESGEIFVVSSDNEESVTVFSGTIDSYNLITGQSSTIKTFEKLHMQDMSRASQEVESGYYLTYGILPTVASATKAKEEKGLRPAAPASTIQIAKTPSFKAVTVTKMAPPIPVPEAVSTPAEPVMLEVNVAEEHVTGPVAIEPQIVVAITPIAVPDMPSAPHVSIASQEAEEVAEPEQAAAIPPLPSFAKVSRQLIEEPVLQEERLDVPAIPIFTAVKATAIVTEPEVPTLPSVPAVPILAKPTIQSVVSEPVSAPIAAPVRPALASSADQQRQSGIIGLEAGYEFTLDGTNSNTLNHRLYAKPYFSKGPFAIRLNGFIETEEFTSFPNSILPVPTGTLNLISYLFTYIDHLRIGYETSPFYLVADQTRSLRSDLSTFFAPSFGQEGRLVLQNKITVGAFTLLSSVDDLRVAGLSGGKSQFASMLLQFTAPKGYALTIAAGALAQVQTAPNRIDLYPLLSFKLPIITNRTTNFSALIQAQGYLPAYPTIDFSQFVDTSLPSFFPNYLIGAGLTLNQGGFSAKMMASLNEGKNHNYLVNSFTYSNLDIRYNSMVDLLAELGWHGKQVAASFALNLPLTSSFGLASLTADGHGADFSQLSVEVKVADVTVTLGLQQLGIISTIKGIGDGSIGALDLLSGPHASSYLGIGYTWAPFTFSAKATYPAKNSSFTVPIISVTAKVDVNKRL